MPLAVLGRALSLLLLAWSATPSPGHADSGTETLRLATSAHCEWVIDIRRDEEPACWREECKDSPPREIGCDLSAMHQIAAVELAPDRSTLAVISVGEGHPVLDLVPFEALQKNGEYDARCSINPYPGTLNLNGWQHGRWRIESDADLNIIDSGQRVDTMNGTNYTFTVAPGDCQLLAVPAR